MHAETFLNEFASLASGPGSISKLRDLILQLAVRGKLVSQIASEGDSEGILDAIADASDTTIKPRWKKYASADAIYDIPNSWRWTSIGRISRDWGQIVPAAPFLYIDVGGIDNKKGKIGEQLELVQSEDAPSRARKLVARGTVIYSTVRPYLRNIAIVDREFPHQVIASTAFAIVHPLGGVLPEFLFYYLRSPDFVSYVEGQMMGVAYPAINDSKFFSAPIPLPPVAEQKRIAAKVDELMTLCDELEARQEEVTGLKRAATVSALHYLAKAKTPEEAINQWSLLMPRFGELFDDLETIKELRGSIRDAATVGLLAPKSDARDWRDITVDDVLVSSNSGWSPMCDNIPARGDEWGVLKVSAVTWGAFKPEENKRLPGGLEPRTQHTLKKGDILVSRANTAELVGRGVKVDADYPRLMLSDKIVRLVLSDEINPDYFLLAYHSSRVRAYFSAVATGTSDSMRNITRDHIKAAPLFLPSLAEQKRVVARVNELMGLCDRLEEHLREGDRLNAELLASLVHALTETDPDGGGTVGERGRLTEAKTAFAAPDAVSDVQSERSGSESAFAVRLLETERRDVPPAVAGVDTKYKEAVLVSAIVKAFFMESGEPVGNFRLQKAVYFARRHNGEHIGQMAYLRKAAGPYNPSMKYSGGIAVAKQKKWLHEARGRFGFGHVPGPAAGEMDDWIVKYGYGESARWVAEQFRFKKNEEWETLASVDYAMEHLRSLGIEPDAVKILQYIRTDDEWRPKVEKLRLTETSIDAAMVEVKAHFGAKGEERSP